jgi:phage shock protein C
MTKKKLYRSKKNRIIAGICGGIAEYLDADPTVVRLLWAIVTIFTGFVLGIITYLVAWLIVPEN